MPNKIFQPATFLIIISIFFSCNTTQEEKALSKTINYNNFPIEKVAQTPPFGWNSWDVFGTDVTEVEVKAMTDYMAENLKQHGYEYIVVDLAWYAIEQVERSMVFSTSPGATNSWDRSFLFHFAEMYRISGDFWDNWPSLLNMFNRAQIFKGHTGPGGWADCDMIPLGVINIRGEQGDGARMTRFTQDEQYTLMSFWTIFRSPLMLGMDLTQLDEFSMALLTNEKALDINQNSTNNDELFNNEDMSIWGAESADVLEKYIAVFNFIENAIRYNLNLKELLPELGEVTSGYDIWLNKELDVDELKNLNVNSHGVSYLVVK